MRKLFNIKFDKDLNFFENPIILLGLLGVVCFYIGYMIGKDLAL